MADTDILAMHAAARPDKPAVIFRGQTTDFATLNRRVNQAANVLLSLGCQTPDRVSVMSFNSLSGVEVGHAVRKAGLVVTPINYRLRPPEVAYVLNDSGAKVVLAGPEHVDVVEAARADVKNPVSYVAFGERAPAGWLSYRDLTNAASDVAPEIERDGAGLGPSMIYTSGTTGHPKGAWRPHGLSLENVMQVISIFGLNQSDVHLLCGPGYHSAPAFFTALHQLLGCTLVVEPKFDGDEALDLIVANRVTTTFMAPTLLGRLLDAQERKPRDLSSLRALILGAAPCPYPLKVRANKLIGPVLWEFYGATETGINTVLRPEDQLRKPGSCGTAVDGQEIRLVDAQGHDVPDGTPGEFMVRNNALAEYYHRPDATSNSLHDGFFSVGDVAYRDDEGFYYICDRAIDMIISGGSNIYPAEVEAVLHAHPAVADAAVIGVPDDEFGESVKAVVQLRPGMHATAEELIAFCDERIAGYKKPRSVDFVDEIPREPAGKLLKRVLRERYWAGAGRRI